MFETEDSQSVLEQKEWIKINFVNINLVGGVIEMDYGVGRGKAFDMGKMPFKSQGDQVDMR